MIAIAFILFAILIIAWVMAPSGEKVAKPVTSATPLLATSKAGAD